MFSTHAHTHVGVHYQTVSKVMCAQALCAAFFSFQKDFVGKMWQIHGKCGKDHTEKQKSQHWQQLVSNNSKKKVGICLLLTLSFALERVARWCPCPV